MRFARLRLNGFKSFVDPTDLLISDGLTGVVGPNGCGKSNLLEALRWVMGENRASAMRGDGMEDVIFAGAASRPARNFAEVALTIDNAERLAPSGFNEADTLEIVRRITRDAGSAFRANAREVRARDVQMLFADASTGAHSPALVRQGQISELINARPKNRRRVLEEAAGISGLYQRRHEAELKLSATEVNLARVQDVVDQLAVQIAQLLRQVRAAARYREIGSDLRQAEGMLLYRRWREADRALAAAAADLTDRIRAAALAEAAARAVAAARGAAEAALPPLREEETIAAAVLQRLAVERDTLAAAERQARDTITTLQSRILQLAQDKDRELGLNHDASESIARLDREAEALAAAHLGHDARMELAGAEARTAAAALQDLETGLGQRTEDAARLAARHQSAHRLLQDTQTTLVRAETAVATARTAEAEATGALARATKDHAEAVGLQAEAAATAENAEATLGDAEAARAETQGREADARAGRSAAEGEANALRAEAAALAKLVARESSAGQQVLDLLSVEPGYEAALGAALADDLRAPVITGAAVSGWAALPDYDPAPPLPQGVRPMAGHVGAPPVLARRIGQIGIADRDQGAALQPLLQPGQRLVSLDGDLWRWDGFRAGAEDAPSAAALRLQQINRLVALKRDLEEVSARATGTRQAHEALTARLADLARADQMARDARREADRRLNEANRAGSRAEADQAIAAGKLEAARLAQARFEAEASAARGLMAEAQAGIAELGDLDAARAALAEVKQRVEAARITLMARRAALDELRREGDTRTRRAAEVTRERTTWANRLDTAQLRMADLEARTAAAAADLATAVAIPPDIARKRDGLADALTRADLRCRNAADALALAETARHTAAQTERDAERGASESREARARADARHEAARDLLEQAATRVGEEAETTPAALLDQLATDADAMPDAQVLEADVNRLKRQREALGAVNLRAEEDAAEVQGEHDTLVAEKADLEAAVKKLRVGIAALNREGRERLLTAFEQVNSNFTLLFTHLFGGGEARLVLVESDDPLEAGLEILCQPPGKKLSTLSLLSGGEQTLTALALIFGVFLANPAPICVLDEVDAPLDDANVTRFCDLLDEMTRRTDTRFLVITHHSVTMSRMDRLFGVTMAEQGVSQLVSVDLKRAAALVA